MTRFEVWAPDAGRMRLVLGGGARAMERRDGGWWVLDVPEAGPGTDYAYLIGDDDTPRPDPRSRWQPGGVHGPSRVYDHRGYRWRDAAWTGRILAGSVIYELHIGTFTPAGTFDSAIERLDHLVALGVDTVEVLPVNAFNGEYNWGYDGVGWYAVHEPYGGPDGLKRFVDACHERGLAVLIDAVYNHFGPSGAYAPMFAPYLTEGASTWGRLVNLNDAGSDEVRRYLIDSALAWLRDFHADGLRLDAVHALIDHGATHLLEQMAAEVDALSAHLNRPLTLIAESDQNDPRLVTPRAAGGYGLTAQWTDDVHHALHTLLTGETAGYYADFAGEHAAQATDAHAAHAAPDYAAHAPADYAALASPDYAALAAVYAGAFFHAGTYSSFRGRTHGRPVDRARTPGWRFVACLQNHDQVGNRAAGDRLSATLCPARLRVGALLLLTGPFTPMLFMGEEWAAGTPWQFFTSHPEPELAAAVSGGRLAEFARHGWDPSVVPDPQDPDTFARSHLDWSEPDRPAHAAMLATYRELIALRRRIPDLSDPRLDRVEVTADGGVARIRRGGHTVAVNLGPEPAAVTTGGSLVYATGPAVALTGGVLSLPADTGAIIAT